MPSLCDVNFLLPIAYTEHVFHKTAVDWLDDHNAPRQFILCRVCQLSVLRLLTNPAVMGGNVLTLVNAWRVWDAIVADDRFVLHAEPDGIEPAMREQTAHLSFSPKLWQDAYLAAFAIASSIQLVTFDRAFRQFKGLDLMLLGE